VNHTCSQCVIVRNQGFLILFHLSLCGINRSIYHFLYRVLTRLTGASGGLDYRIGLQ
jgi:hypothetical protein